MLLSINVIIVTKIECLPGLNISNFVCMILTEI